MRYRKLLFSFVLLMSQITASSQNPASVFITAGQSNAEGRESVEYLPAILMTLVISIFVMPLCVRNSQESLATLSSEILSLFAM